MESEYVFVEFCETAAVFRGWGWDDVAISRGESSDESEEIGREVLQGGLSLVWN